MTEQKSPLRTRSFQNCKETDIHGYNDCPSFLFNVSKKGGRKNRLHTSFQDTYGNTKLPITPPPISKKNSSSSNEEEQQEEQKQEENDMGNGNTELGSDLTGEDVLAKINELINKNSNLSAKEYEFYKRKVDLNLPKCIYNNDFTRSSLSQFLQIIDNKTQQADFLRKWMLMDTTISNWCPAFLKLVENVQE